MWWLWDRVVGRDCAGGGRGRGMEGYAMSFFFVLYLVVSRRAQVGYYFVFLSFSSFFILALPSQV